MDFKIYDKTAYLRVLDWLISFRNVRADEQKSFYEIILKKKNIIIL